MPSPAPLAPEVVDIKRLHYLPLVGATLRELAVQDTLDSSKCLLLPGDDISPNKLTMPPVAIECVRNIRREALASFWEACHVAKHNVTKPDHIWFLGCIEDLVRVFDSAMETDKNRYGGT